MTVEINVSKHAGQHMLEPEALALVEEAGLTVIEHRTATTAEEAMAEADQIGYPVALKLICREIVHKTEVEGVQLDLRDAAAVGTAFRQVMERAARHRPGAQIDGTLVCRMAMPGTEVILGITRDPQFGPALMFGLGGIFVEVYRDITFRLAPISERDAVEMIHEIKGFPVLTGARGRRPRDLDALVRSLLILSSLAQSRPEIDALDLNPVILYERGCVVVDAKVFLRDSERRS